MTSEGDWRTTFRPDIPSSARIYDYLLGGKDNFPADREAAEEMVRQSPKIRAGARMNRAFVRRAVRYLVREEGILQLLDIGAGLPTQGNVHEIALAENPEARVVYVDHDPVVLAHVRDLLDRERSAVVIQHDVREPEAILTDPELRELFDFDQKVAVLTNAIMHFIPDRDDPRGLIARLLAPFPAGSCLGLTHATADSSAEFAEAVKVMDEATTPAFLRGRQQVLNLVDDLDLVEPGLVWAPTWRPDAGDEIPQDPADSLLYAVVARKG